MVKLKAALTSSSTINQTSSMENLPLVMLSLCTQIKEDLHCSPADLVFGQQLILPGQFLSNHSSQEPTTNFIKYLRNRMSSLAFTSTQFSTKDIYVPSSLHESEFVFVRQDAVKKPLTSHYAGPFRVLARNEKYYTLQFNHGKSNVSIDRLKPAYIECDAKPSQPPTPSTSLDNAQPATSQQQQQQQTTKGRTVHWPRKFKNYVTY